MRLEAQQGICLRERELKPNYFVQKLFSLGQLLNKPMQPKCITEGLGGFLPFYGKKWQF